MAKIEITSPPSSGGGGTVNTGVLQTLGGGPLTASAKIITDQLGTNSALQLSTGEVRIGASGATSGLKLFVLGGDNTAGNATIESNSLSGANSFKIFNNGDVRVISAENNTANIRNLFGRNYSSTPGNEPFKFIGGRARGTSTAPTAVQSGDFLASFAGNAYDGTTFTDVRGGLSIVAAENWTSVNNGTYLAFRGTTAGGTTISEFGRLQSTGLTISTIQNATTDTDKFLVSDGGVVKYRTGTELLSDLGLSGTLITGSGVSGRITYFDGTNTVTGDADLVWNAANTRLGIGVASPTQRLEVIGNTKTTGLIISTATAQSTTATQYLSLDATDSTVKYRTPAQVLSDIGAQAALTNPVTGTGTATQVAYWSTGTAITGSANLFWDAANNRLGVNDPAPTGKLSIIGTGSTTGTALLVRNNTPTALFSIIDSGLITAFAPSINVTSGTTEIIKSTSSFIAAVAGSGSFRPLSIAYTINNSAAQTGTATGIFLNATETALNGMTHRLLDLQVGGTSVASISSNGSISGVRVFSSGGSGLTYMYGTDNLIYLASNPIKGHGTATQFGISIATALLVAATNPASGTAPTVASAILQVDSTTKGFLLPRMTTAQRVAIATPANGLMVYDTDLGQPCFYDTVNTRWNKIAHAPA